MKNGYYEDEYGEYWYLNDMYHREDGPAIIYAYGSQLWWINNKLHREDGPAVIHSDGTKFWWVNDKNITTEVNKWFNDYNLTYDTLTDEEKWYLIFYVRSLI